jgi:hypothetical protein
MCIHLNPYELEWNRIKFSLISLQYISTHVDWDEYMRIKQGLTYFLLLVAHVHLSSSP